MSHDEEGHGGGGWGILWWFLAIIVGLWVLWYYTGRPQRAVQEGDDPYLKPPATVGANPVPYNSNPTH